MPSVGGRPSSGARGREAAAYSPPNPALRIREREDMSGAHVLDGLLDPLSRCLDAESARRVVEMRLDPAIQERLTLLANHANEGALSGEERNEYEALVNAADFVSVLQPKARQSLPSNGK